MPLGRRPLFAVTLGLWLAVLLAMLLGSATILAVDTVSLGDMRWIGTDPSVTSVVVDRMTLFVALAVVVSAVMVRVWVGAAPASNATTTAGSSVSAVHAGVIRLVAGGALLLTATAAMIVVQLTRVFS